MKYFTLSELTATTTGLPNQPGVAETKNLETLVKKVLDPIREIMGIPIIVTSGFRSFAVNKKVGGAATSQHLRGEAADLICADNKKLYSAIMDNLEFDQLIWEKGNDNQPAWVHVSYRHGFNRKQVLRIK